MGSQPKRGDLARQRERGRRQRPGPGGRARVLGGLKVRGSNAGLRRVASVRGAGTGAGVGHAVNRRLRTVGVPGLDPVVRRRLSAARGVSTRARRGGRGAGDTHRISAIRSSIAYHARGEYATPRHQPSWSAGSRNACACRWSVTGILLSLNGGVMNPMRTFVPGGGAGGGAENALGLWAPVVAAAMCEESSRVATDLMEVKSGTSLEDCAR